MGTRKWWSKFDKREKKKEKKINDRRISRATSAWHSAKVGVNTQGEVGREVRQVGG